ncbi:Cell wall protein 1, partial [Candida tropicalis]
MPTFAGAIGNCIADNCRGNNVVVATSLAYSICSSAGVWEPYWMPPASVTTRLNEAAAAEPTDETSSPQEETSAVEETSAQEPQHSSSEQPEETSAAAQPEETSTAEESSSAIEE